MAFPTTSILSSFTGADEDPISEGGAWGATGIRTSTSPGRKVSGEFARAAAVTTGFDGIWNTSFAADQEAFVTYSVLSGSGSRPVVYARIQNEGTSSVVAYNFGYVQAAGTWRFFRLNNLTFTQVGGDHAGADLAAGDSFGISVIGTTLEGWFKAAGGSWVSLGTETDTNIAGAGKIGIQLQNNLNMRVDEFGGGEIVPASSASFMAISRRG